MFDADALSLLEDPIKFKDIFWPDSVLTDYQVEILHSVQRNKITVVPAGNKLGKDYIAAFTALWFYCSRTPAKVITTSVDGSQLEGVLWGEIRNFMQSAKYPLPLKANHLHLRQMMPDGTYRGNSEFVGRVVDRGEGLLGRHLPYGPNMSPRVLAVVDEASGFDDGNYMGIDTWAHRILIIGNTFPCENFFKRLVKGGNVKSDAPHLDYDINVIKIPASLSPNVRLAQAEVRAGKPMSRRIIVPGCMDIDDYNFRMKTYDPVKKAAGLFAEFYEGEEVRVFPQEWLMHSQIRGDALLGKPRMDRRTLGIDPAEGGDNTVWTVVDELGLIEQCALRTTNTAMIKGRTLALMKKHNIKPEDVIFDRGGGGKEHADYMRDAGYAVRSIGFGESPSDPDEHLTGWTDPEDRSMLKEERYVYKNKRAQFYGCLRERMNPDRYLNVKLDDNGEPLEDLPLQRNADVVFGIPSKYTELIRQLSPLPLLYDGEGRMYLPPKDNPSPTYKGVTIKKLLGSSPDESDSLVLAVFALSYTEATIGAF